MSGVCTLSHGKRRRKHDLSIAGISGNRKGATSVAIDCLACKKRSTCTRLCKRAEKYVSQDEADQREKLFTAIGCSDDILDPRSNPFTMINLSTKLWVVKLFFLNHVRQSQICEMMYVSRQYVSRTIKEYRPIIRQIRRENEITHTRVHRGG